MLRRKIAVRLRAGVRASDVVAAIDDEHFAVLLGTLLSRGRRGAGRREARRRDRRADPRSAAASARCRSRVGIAHYPQDGNQAERLLRRALALAAVAPALSHAGPAAIAGSGGELRPPPTTSLDAGGLARRAAPRPVRRCGTPSPGRRSSATRLPLRLRRAPPRAPPARPKHPDESRRDPFHVPEVLRIEGPHHRRRRARWCPATTRRCCSPTPG